MKLYSRLRLLALCFSTFLLAACGGSGGSTSSEFSEEPGVSEEFGELQIVLTDAEDDFLTYQVEIDSVTLIGVGGREVDVLATTTEVDFVQYQELSELFAVRSIPAGNYDSIELMLDYTNAEIVIQDELGNPIVAQPVDEDGAPVGELTVELQFGDAETIFVSPLRVANLTLDLDLEASNEILSYDPAQVLVEPFLIATAELDENREHRVRGLLESVDTASSSFVMDLLPMRLRNGSFGEITINVGIDTIYNVDGIDYTGGDGLAAMDLLAADSPVVAFGSYNPNIERPVADIVYAGTSVPWHDDDIIKGTVTSREGNVLTIAGAVIEVPNASGFFARNIALTVDDTTTVNGYRLGAATIDNLSVGQNILAVGDYTEVASVDESEDGMPTGSFDATGETVRMRLSRFIGQVETVSPLTVDVAAMNRRIVDIYDFTGTGMTVDLDADPENYEVDTANLDLANLEENEWIQVRGYPTAFGSAPEDFDAVSIIDPAQDSARATLIALWEEGAADPVTINANDLEFNFDDSRMVLQVGLVPLSLLPSFELGSVTGVMENGVYAIHVRGERISIFRDYTDFLVELDAQLALGDEARKVTARGEYDSIDEVLTANTIVIKF